MKNTLFSTVMVACYLNTAIFIVFLSPVITSARNTTRPKLLGSNGMIIVYAVYENGTMVGFVMYGYFPTGGDDEENYTGGTPCYYVWRLFVDKDHQGKGIGREILRQVMEEIKMKPYGDAEYCYSSYEPDNMKESIIGDKVILRALHKEDAGFFS
ncbi:MAG: GNAT family N-acetyltransferase [Oscillospiraceae bacterium]|nr:GNAT family N-acetyltransferase [Oscillospiraceae bacterium]